MLKIVIGAIVEYVEENRGLVFFVGILFLVGIISGALYVNFLDEQQRLALNQTFLIFFETMNIDSSSKLLDSLTILKASYQKNIGMLLIIWFLGYLWFGFPLILLLLFYKGFSLGFTVGFLVYHSSLKGLLFSSLSILPHHLFYFPAFIGTASSALIYSILKFKERFTGNYYDKRKQLINHSYFIALMLFFSILGGLTEAYITPVFIRFVFLIF